jgi:hypothetical protein
MLLPPAQVPWHPLPGGRDCGGPWATAVRRRRTLGGAWLPPCPVSRLPYHTRAWAQSCSPHARSCCWLCRAVAPAVGTCHGHHHRAAHAPLPARREGHASAGRSCPTPQASLERPSAGPTCSFPDAGVAVGKNAEMDVVEVHHPPQIELDVLVELPDLVGPRHSRIKETNSIHMKVPWYNVDFAPIGPTKLLQNCPGEHTSYHHKQSLDKVFDECSVVVGHSLHRAHTNLRVSSGLDPN